jgi:hypothetical protein
MKKIFGLILSLFCAGGAYRGGASEGSDLQLRQKMLEKKMAKLSKRINKLIRIKDELRKKMIDFMKECSELKKDEFLKSENVKELSIQQAEEVKKILLDEIEQIGIFFQQSDAEKNDRISLKEINNSSIQIGYVGCLASLKLTIIQMCIHQKIVETVLDELQACVMELLQIKKKIEDVSQIQKI